jgi:ferredoxin
MKVHIDREKCTGHGMCEAAAEDVFEVGDDGIAQLLIDEPGEEHREQIDDAVTVCPAAALRAEG